jgi:hypothetical protein
MRLRTDSLPRTLRLSRDQVRRALAIPSKHFLSRGFSPEVLDAFDVGESAKLKRAVVPLYDDTGEACTGYTVRSLKPPCQACNQHHEPGVDCRWGQQRWGIMGGFPKRTYLYNYARAKKTDSPVIFLTEGPPDVWRLAESGHVAVALLGADATDEQLHKLAALGKTVRVAFDNDPPGVAARERFQRKQAASGIDFPWAFFSAPAEYKDLGETPVEELRRAVQQAEDRGT